MRTAMVVFVLANLMLAPICHAQGWIGFLADTGGTNYGLCANGEVWRFNPYYPGEPPSLHGSFGPGPWVACAFRAPEYAWIYALKSTGEIWIMWGGGEPELYRSLPSDKQWCAFVMNAGLAMTCSGEVWTTDDEPHYVFNFITGAANAETSSTVPLSSSVSPNPSAGACTVSFRVEVEVLATVQVIDATGRIVRHLLDGPHPAGDYSLQWDGKDDAGRDLPAGVYFTHVTTGQGTTTGRVVLAR